MDIRVMSQKRIGIGHLLMVMMMMLMKIMKYKQNLSYLYNLLLFIINSLRIHSLPSMTTYAPPIIIVCGAA